MLKYLEEEKQSNHIFFSLFSFQIIALNFHTQHSGGKNRLILKREKREKKKINKHSAPHKIIKTSASRDEKNNKKKITH